VNHSGKFEGVMETETPKKPWADVPALDVSGDWAERRKALKYLFQGKEFGFRPVERPSDLTFETVAENPILGIGVGTYEVRSVVFMEKYPVPWRQLRWDVASHRIMPETVPVHNEYGRMLAEQGIFSIPLFLMLLWFTYKNLLYARKNTKDPFILLVSIGTMIYLASMAVYWYFHEYFLEEPYVSVIPFMLSIIVYNLVRKEVEERDAPGA